MWRAYVIAGGGTKLYIFDMSNPASPVKLAEQAIATGERRAVGIDSDGKVVVDLAVCG